MTGSEIPLFIALWGAGLSTVLAGIKMWELWRDRSRLDIGYNFTSNPEIGNTILIRNLSSRPLIVSWWELLYCSGCWPMKNCEYVAFAEHDVGDQKIDPHSTFKLNFCGIDYFSSSEKALKGRKIYIRLYVAGRKPIIKKISTS